MIVKVYETALEKSLSLKPGALSLLNRMKALGERIAIITEGPQDAQEWTLQKLGISEKVDYFAKSNNLRASGVTETGLCIQPCGKRC